MKSQSLIGLATEVKMKKKFSGIIKKVHELHELSRIVFCHREHRGHRASVCPCKSVAKNFIVLIMLIWSLPLGCAAAEENLLTLNQALDIALSKNQELKQATNQVQLNQVSVKQKKANFYPSLSLSANSSQHYFKNLDTLTSDYESKNSKTLDGNLSAAVNLFNGFYDTASLQQSQLELKAAEGQLSRSGQAVVFETLQRYIQVVLAKELIGVEEKNLEAQRLQLNMIEDFYKAGKRPVTDLYQQNAEISRYDYQLLESKRDYQVGKLLLLQILGLEPHTGYQVADLEIDKLLKEIKIPTQEAAGKPNLGKRPDLEAQQLMVKAAEKEVKAAQSGYWPKLSFFVNLGTNYSSLDEYANLSHQLFDYNLNAAIGLSLSIPIFDKGSTKNNVAMAKLNVQNQQLELEIQKNQAAVEVQQALEDYRTAAQQVAEAESQLTYAQAALESIEARYKVQAATMVELTQARAQYLQAAYDRVKSKYNLLIQAIATAFYQGDLEEVTTLLRKQG